MDVVVQRASDTVLKAIVCGARRGNRHIESKMGLKAYGRKLLFSRNLGRRLHLPIDLARGFTKGYHWLVDTRAKTPREITKYQETEELRCVDLRLYYVGVPIVPFFAF